MYRNTQDAAVLTGHIERLFYFSGSCEGTNIIHLGFYALPAAESRLLSPKGLACATFTSDCDCPDRKTPHHRQGVRHDYFILSRAVQPVKRSQAELPQARQAT